MSQASYSNSYYNNSQNRAAGEEDEAAVRAMYEQTPYPDLGANLKSLDFYMNAIRQEFDERRPIRFLDIGCGTGHLVVGIAKRYEHWKCYGIDLSEASLAIGAQLSQLHNVSVQFHRGSYLDTLRFEGKFDIINASGTIHHASDPVRAMRRMHDVLKDDGYMFLHLYGWRCDARKFDLKNALDIMEPDLSNYDRRFYFYSTLMQHNRRDWKHRIVTVSLADIYVGIRKKIQNWRRRKKSVSWSPPWTDRYDRPTAPWIDHFCHPCERAYEVPQVKALLKASGFRVAHMLHQGRESPHLIPKEWMATYDQLDNWSKYRLSELLRDGGASFAMILRKIP